MQNKHKYSNDLVLWRQRMRFTQLQVSRLLGKKDTRWLSKLELGERLPGLLTSLKLAAVYRVPVDFLYHKRYCEYRQQIRDREEDLAIGTQGILFGGSV
jgi:transcriptional regulator with XRE-family HTH domain